MDYEKYDKCTVNGLCLDTTTACYDMLFYFFVVVNIFNDCTLRKLSKGWSTIASWCFCFIDCESKPRLRCLIVNEILIMTCHDESEINF